MEPDLVSSGTEFRHENPRVKPGIREGSKDLISKGRVIIQKQVKIKQKEEPTTPTDCDEINGYYYQNVAK